jgi:hypothetical protein
MGAKTDLLLQTAATNRAQAIKNEHVLAGGAKGTRTPGLLHAMQVTPIAGCGWKWLYQQLLSPHVARDGPLSPPACSPSCSPPPTCRRFASLTARHGYARRLVSRPIPPGASARSRCRSPGRPRRPPGQGSTRHKGVSTGWLEEAEGRLTWHLVAVMMAGRGPVWPGAGGRWLLVWLFGLALVLTSAPRSLRCRPRLVPTLAPSLCAWGTRSAR